MNSGSGSGLVQGNGGLDGSESSDEQDEPSSSSSSKITSSKASNNDRYEEVLENFRLKWKNELKISKKRNLLTTKSKFESTSKEDQELTAKNLFLKGVDLEKSGKLYEAIQFYRRAVQLVPDIEFRLEESKRKTKDFNESDDLNESGIGGLNEPENDDTDNDDEDEDLLQTIQKKLNKSDYLCSPKFATNETHISFLPPEIILYILRWIISSDLDIRSLEIFSQVCRGFYVCARDSKIWKSACERTWGLNCGNLSKNLYPSWRQMFLERPKLHFNGCYISKTTYIRHGESSFQDQFYRPWHLVAYYRYLRFFPEGIVLMLTTPDEPSSCVGLLKTRQPKGTNSILTGHYRLKDDSVTIYVNRQETKTFNKRSRRKGDDCNLENNQPSEQTFHLELKIQNHHKRRHVQLVWTRYSIFTKNKTGVESNCTFDLIGNRFPPLWFSRVKSYTMESESPLV